MQSLLRRTLPALALAALAAAPAAAQRETTAGTDTILPVPIAPVTVTVLRTPFSLDEAPFAVSVRTTEEIQRAQPGLALDEALRGIPGVQVDNRYNYALGERISIRGFGARAQFGVRGVKVLVDGIPATLPDGQTTLNHVDLSLLARAEVVRGPASTLYGNAAGGVIQLETEAPPAGRLEQEVGFAAGADGLRRLYGTLGGRTGPASYLFHASGLAYGGYRAYSEADNVRVNGRLGLERGRNDFRLVFNLVDYTAENPGSLSEALLAADRSQAFARNVAQRTGESARQGQLGATLRRRMDAGELEIAAHGVTRTLDNPIPNAIIDLDRLAGGARALFRAHPAGALGLRWSAGAEVEAQEDDRLNFANRGGERGPLALDQHESVRSLGLFGQLSAEPTERLTLLGGVRYDRFRFAVDDALVTAGNGDDSGSRILDALSPSLGVSFALAEALHLYGNVATSFETPTTTELANRPDGSGGFNPLLEPQRALSAELGTKGVLGRRFAYQMAAYRARVEDALIPFEVPDAPGRQFFRNAGSALHRGVEAAATAAPLRGVSLQASYTWTDARFRDYVVDGTSFRDEQVPGIAPHRADASLTLDAPRGWFATLQGRYASRTPVNDANTAHSPAYGLLDARGGIEAVRIGGFRVAPYVGVTNLLDREYNTSVIVNAFGQRYFEPGPGRALYSGASVRF